MSSIVDRRAGRPVSFSSVYVQPRTELLFWTALILFAAAVLGVAAVGSSHAYTLPSETFFVGP
jgi:hypothetical protein